MATFTWNGSSGNYDSADWLISGSTTLTSPGSADIAVLSGSGAYTVTIPWPPDFVLGHTVTLDDPNAVMAFEGLHNVVGTFDILAGTFETAGTLDTSLLFNTTAIVNDGTIISDGQGLYGFGVFGIFSNKGQVVVNGDSLGLENSAAPASTNSGTIAVSNFGTVSFLANTLLNTGLMTLASGATLSFLDVTSGNVTTAGTIEFLDGSGATLITGSAGMSNDSAGMFPSTVDGFQAGDTIDLANAYPYSTLDSVGISGGDIVYYVGSTPFYYIPVTNVESGVTLSVTSDTLGYAEITAACFAAGTRIATARGDIPVERLRVGDHVLGLDGSAHPAIWLGRRRVECRRHPRPHDAWPVRVEAGAFGPNVPRRRVFLSPDHAVFVDGVLIPVRCLLNGRTVFQVPCAAVTYWHVELSNHRVILAEGLPSESYLDTGNRSAFEAPGPGGVDASYLPGVSG